MLRDHRKILVIDNRVAFVGGMGITDKFDNVLSPDHYWHDVAVRAEGPVVSDWSAVFKRNWDVWARKNIRIPENNTSAGEIPNGQTGRVAAGRYFGRSEIQRSFVKRVLSAEHHVWMMTAYFVPAHRLLRAMRMAAHRGADVRLLVPGPETDHPSVRYAGRRHFNSLMRAGVRIFEYQPRFMHAKVLLCDGWVSLGSSNVDRWNLRWNLEGNQEIEDSHFALSIRELFEADIQESRECVPQVWRTRSRRHRWQEWFWGHTERLIERLAERLRRPRNKP